MSTLTVADIPLDADGPAHPGRAVDRGPGFCNSNNSSGHTVRVVFDVDRRQRNWASQGQ